MGSFGMPFMSRILLSTLNFLWGRGNWLQLVIRYPCRQRQDATRMGMLQGTTSMVEVRVWSIELPIEMVLWFGKVFRFPKEYLIYSLNYIIMILIIVLFHVHQNQFHLHETTECDVLDSEEKVSFHFCTIQRALLLYKNPQQSVRLTDSGSSHCQSRAEIKEQEHWTTGPLDTQQLLLLLHIVMVGVLWSGRREVVLAC